MASGHSVIPASYLIFKRADEILLLERANTGYMDGYYSFVAGHVDPNESFTEAMIREAYEEVGIKIKPEQLTVAHIQHRKSDDSERVDTFFVTEDWEGEICNMEPHKCANLNWFNIKELPENIIPHLADVVEYIQNNKHYSEHGWD